MDDPRGFNQPPRHARRRRRAPVVATLVVLVLLAGAYLAAIAFGLRSNESPAAAFGPPSSPGSSGAASSAPTRGSPGPSPSRPTAASTLPATAPVLAPAGFVFPVVGQVTYDHTHHDYPATDILTPCGNPVVAVTSGIVLDTVTVDAYNVRVNAGDTRGGLSVSILGDDGVRYYGSHLSRLEPNIAAGVRVAVGQRLGEVGETGNASACHLHFGISPPCSLVGDWWIQRGVIWPGLYLDSWQGKGNRSPAAEAASWLVANGCPRGPVVDP